MAQECNNGPKIRCSGCKDPFRFSDDDIFIQLPTTKCSKLVLCWLSVHESPLPAITWLIGPTIIGLLRVFNNCVVSAGTGTIGFYNNYRTKTCTSAIMEKAIPRTCPKYNLSLGHNISSSWYLNFCQGTWRITTQNFVKQSLCELRPCRPMDDEDYNITNNKHRQLRTPVMT